MNHASRKRLRTVRPWLALLFLAAALNVHAQICLSDADLEPSARAPLEATAKRYFEMSARGDIAGLRQSSIASMASNFATVENTVKENQPDFGAAHASVRSLFLLTAEGAEPLPRAEFLCGVFGKSGQTASSSVFVLHNLPPGKYGVAVLDISGGKEPRTLTLILQLTGADWKLAGYYVRSNQAAGHDGAWYAERARGFKAKSQNHNAWLYYRLAVALTAPVDFMSTLSTDKLYDELQAVQPADMPANGNAIDVTVPGKTYRWTDVFPLAVGNDIDLVLKYSASDISNTQKTYEQNSSVSRVVVAKFPELRDAFAGVVARAVDPSGQDYGSLLPMKDIK